MDDDEAWAKFLAGPIGASATPDERAVLRTRVPLQHRTPTEVLYWGLLLYHRGRITLEELEANIDENEQLAQSVAAKLARNESERDGKARRLRLVRGAR